MNDFRNRILLPFLLPLGVVIGFVAFAFSLSRVLLAVPEWVAVVLAIAVAAYILVVAAFVVGRPRISSRSLGVGLGVGLFAVVVAGTIAGAAGVRELHDAHEGEEAGGPVDEAETADGELPPDAALFVAVDIDFTAAPETLNAGPVPIAIENQGNIVHNVAFDEIGGGEPVVEAEGGESAVETVTLEPGTYTYFCSIPGHRAAGMEGTLVVN